MRFAAAGEPHTEPPEFPRMGAAAPACIGLASKEEYQDMRSIRTTWLTAIALSLTAATAQAAPPQNQHGVNGDTIARAELNLPLQLTQTSTSKVNDSTSHSAYTGTGTLTVTPCGDGAAPYTLPVRLDLVTTTTLNDCGDGFTNGSFALTNPDTNQAISGDLAAVNRNFGELDGLLNGNLRYRLDQFSGRHGDPHVNVALRATFHATFVQDANGDYTLVNVDDAHGVLFAPNANNRGGNDGVKGHGGHDDR
jgi:hypothetical protein